MIHKEVKRILVEYKDGSKITYTGDDMFHVERDDFPRGAAKPEQGHTSHIIRWTDPKRYLRKRKRKDDS